MSRLQQTVITYDADGEVAAINHKVVQPGTVNFGDGPQPTEREKTDHLHQGVISSATRAVIVALVDALEIDIAAERQRIADAAQAEADQAAKNAQEAAVKAQDLASSGPTG